MRDALIVGTLCIIAIAAGAWVFLHGSPFASGDASLPGSVAFSVLAEGTDASTITDPVNYRLVSKEELSTLWEMLGRTDLPPKVDFEKSEVLAVFDGERATGGYSVVIGSVTNTEDTRIVLIRHTVPGKGCMVSEALTHPYILIEVPKTTLSLTHTRETVETSCE